MGRASVKSTSRRNTDRALLATYYEAKLAELLERVRDGFAQYDTGRLDAFGLDEIIRRYSSASREVGRFCGVSGANVEVAARTLEAWRKEGKEPDWWQIPTRRIR